jgi:hypothetical protein
MAHLIVEQALDFESFTTSSDVSRQLPSYTQTNNFLSISLRWAAPCRDSFIDPSKAALNSQRALAIPDPNGGLAPAGREWRGIRAEIIHWIW